MSPYVYKVLRVESAQLDVMLYDQNGRVSSAQTVERALKTVLLTM